MIRGVVILPMRRIGQINRPGGLEESVRNLAYTDEYAMSGVDVWDLK